MGGRVNNRSWYGDALQGGCGCGEFFNGSGVVADRRLWYEA